MKAGTRPKDNTIIDEWIAAQHADGDSAAAWRANIQLANDLRGIRDVAPYEARAEVLRKSKTVKDELKAERSAHNKEAVLTQNLIRYQTGLDDPATRDDSERQLRSTVNDLKRRSAADSDTPDRRASRRALAGIFAMLVEGNRQYLERNQYDLAAVRNDIAADIPPDRPGVWLEAARLLELAGDKKRAQYWRDRAEKAGVTQPPGRGRPR
ncbi:MAG: hypothetical protein ABI823_02135, partial [Bryobacteraceae bacterium]